MRFYLAARYESRRELCAIRNALRESGHIVTSRWLDALHDGAPPERCALEDLQDIGYAEALVLFANSALAPVERSMRGGKHVEFGYAYGLDKAVHLVGEPENVFHHAPRVIRHRDVQAFLASHAVVWGWRR